MGHLSGAGWGLGPTRSCFKQFFDLISVGLDPVSLLPMPPPHRFSVEPTESVGDGSLGGGGGAGRGNLLSPHRRHSRPKSVVLNEATVVGRRPTRSVQLPA